MWCFRKKLRQKKKLNEYEMWEVLYLWKHWVEHSISPTPIPVGGSTPRDPKNLGMISPSGSNIQMKMKELNHPVLWDWFLRDVTKNLAPSTQRGATAASLRCHWAARTPGLWRGHDGGDLSTYPCSSIIIVRLVYKTLYGSRSKTHARLLVSEWHLQIWTCVFTCVAKGRESAAKGFAKDLNTTIFTKHAHQTWP